MRVIETERLILRPFTLEDVEAAHALLDVHPDVWRFDPGFAPSLDQRRQVLVGRIAEYETDLGRTGIGLRALVSRRSGALIGYCGLQVWLSRGRLAPEDGPHASLEVELYYKLGREHWGQGLATESSQAVLRLAFEEVGLRRIATVTDRQNARSIALLRRLGAEIIDSPTSPDQVIGLIRNPRPGQSAR
ncbi:MAG TPA: GNAT family N-acetyltransferase [Chloroflexota bacterium]|jgi:RimJ/RimL family protein N-acetyltransferase